LYVDSIPSDLDEAAAVNGCGPLRTLVQIVVLAAVPGIVAVAGYAPMPPGADCGPGPLLLPSEGDRS
jgi:ABC-type maltose transport system permease subunit